MLDTDIDDLFDYYRRPGVARYLSRPPLDRAEALAFMERARDAPTTLTDEGQTLPAAVILRETGRLIGDIQLRWLSRPHRQGEIGFAFHPDHAGHGYATEAAGAMLRFGFDTVGLHRVIGRCDARNGPSMRVLERLGMRREAHFIHSRMVKDEWIDELEYAIRDDGWRRRHRERPV